MTEALIVFFDLIGTIAFAISGALIGISKKMDLFGTLVLDMIVGSVPPAMCRNPVYVVIAAVVATIVFLLVFFHTHMPRMLAPLYDKMLFWFDTLGLAAFTVDGVMVGIQCGYGAGRIPDIFLKHVYAVAAIAGGLLLTLTRPLGDKPSMILGFSLVIALRCLAAHYRWNLPRIRD